MRNEITINLIVEKIVNPKFWNYEASMIVFGKKRFLTYADSMSDAKKIALGRLKTLLLKTPLPD